MTNKNESIQDNDKLTCIYCEGVGRDLWGDDPRKKCPECGGKGWYVQTEDAA